MKVLGISGSMRRDGNTTKLVNAVLDSCRSAEIGTEFVSLADKEIKPCLGCEKCREERWCVLGKDDWDEVAEKMIECEVLVFGAPTYYYDICGHAKNFIDRTYSLYHDRKLAGRRAVAVAMHADKGGTRTIETIEGFLNAHEFSNLGWVLGRGYLQDDVLKDSPAMQKAKALGDKIVSLLRPAD